MSFLWFWERKSRGRCFKFSSESLRKVILIFKYGSKRRNSAVFLFSLKGIPGKVVIALVMDQLPSLSLQEFPGEEPECTLIDVWGCARESERT